MNAMIDDQAGTLPPDALKAILAGLEANPRWADVLAAVRAQGAATEREACAQLADREADRAAAKGDFSAGHALADLADLIRARTTPQAAACPRHGIIHGTMQPADWAGECNWGDTRAVSAYRPGVASEDAP